MLAKILEMRGCPFANMHNWLVAIYYLGYLQRSSEDAATVRQQVDAAIAVMSPK